jgi:hypothetical protein
VLTARIRDKSGTLGYPRTIAVPKAVNLCEPTVTYPGQSQPPLSRAGKSQRGAFLFSRKIILGRSVACGLCRNIFEGVFRAKGDRHVTVRVRSGRPAAVAAIARRTDKISGMKG